ncbi:hypothetical protein Tco_1470824, partial [Tanacetum coccineum]
GPVVQGKGSTHPESVVPQPRSPTRTNVADGAASTGVDVRLGGATTTVISLEAGQGSGNIDKTPTMPYDSPLPRFNTLRSDEGKKTIKTGQARRKAKLVVSDDEEDLEDPSKQGRKIVEIDQDPDISLVQHDAEVQGRHEHDIESDFEFTTAEEVYTTEKGVSTTKPVSTVGASVSTASATALRLQEQLDEEEKQRIVRVHEAASSFNIEEWEDIQARIKADEELAQSYTLQQLRGYSFDEIKSLFEATMKRVNTFTPIESDVDRTVPKIAAGSSKRDAEEELGQESSKRQTAKEPRDKESDELSQEELQKLMIIVPEEGMNIKALQTKYPIID